MPGAVLPAAVATCCGLVTCLTAALHEHTGNCVAAQQLLGLAEGNCDVQLHSRLTAALECWVLSRAQESAAHAATTRSPSYNYYVSSAYLAAPNFAAALLRTGKSHPASVRGLLQRLGSAQHSQGRHACCRSRCALSATAAATSLCSAAAAKAAAASVTDVAERCS